MTERVFEIRTEPHRAVIGETVLLFTPEASGGEFLTAYSKLRHMQTQVSKKTGGTKASSSKHTKAADVELDIEVLAELSATMRDFVAQFLMPESVPVFNTVRLPDRILLELIEFAAELYGGGSGNPGADGGTSTD